MTHSIRILLLSCSVVFLSAFVHKKGCEDIWNREFIINGFISKNGIPLKNQTLFLIKRFRQGGSTKESGRPIVTDEDGYYWCTETVYVPFSSSRKEIRNFINGGVLNYKDRLYDWNPQILEFTYGQAREFKPSPFLEVAGRYYVDQVPNTIVVRLDVDFRV
jgi:hypothetical protein